jgi:hypothetical protein
MMLLAESLEDEAKDKCQQPTGQERDDQVSKMVEAEGQDDEIHQ